MSETGGGEDTVKTMTVSDPKFLFVVKSASRHPSPEYAYVFHICESITADEAFTTLHYARLVGAACDPRYIDSSLLDDDSIVYWRNRNPEFQIIIPTQAIQFIGEVEYSVRKWRNGEKTP